MNQIGNRPPLPNPLPQRRRRRRPQRGIVFEFANCAAGGRGSYSFSASVGPNGSAVGSLVNDAADLVTTALGAAAGAGL